MLRRGIIALAPVLALVAGAAFVAAPAAHADLPPGCSIVIVKHVPTVVCQNGDSQPGSTPALTTSADGTGSGSGDGDGSGGSDQPVSFDTYDGIQCVSEPSEQPAPAGTTIQGTQVAGSVVMWCESGIDGGPPFYFWSTPAAPPPPIDLVALSRQARAQIAIPQFTLEFGPKASQLAVNMATTFTAVPDRSMNLSASASDQGITVTVSGRLQGMTWYPDEPVECTAGDRGRACSGGTVGPVTCAGTRCQYVYKWVSSPARTGGSAVWPVTANATWQFTYTTAITGGATTTGATTATWTETMPAGTGTVSMGEWNTVGGFSN